MATGYAGLVPMFCPDQLACAMKASQPLMERLPGVRAFACAVVVYVCVRR